MRMIKVMKFDTLKYLYDIPYTVTFDLGKKIAVIDLVYCPDIINITFWQQVLPVDFGILPVVLRMMDKYPNERVLKSIVTYYFSDLILRQLSFLPDYVHYPELNDDPLTRELITKDKWQYHIICLNTLREKSRTTLNNHRIKTRNLVIKIKSYKQNDKKNSMKAEEFRKRMKKLIIEYPEVLTELLFFIPQKQITNTLGKDKLLDIVKQTKNHLIKLEYSTRIDSNTPIASREAVYYVHTKLMDELPEFPIIRHIMDTIVADEISKQELYKALNKTIKMHITLLNELEKHLNSLTPKSTFSSL